MAERRGIMCGCFWSQSTGWRINFFCSVTHSGRAVGYDAGQTRSWFARIDFYIRFLFSLMTSLFHNINRTWSRRRVSRGESNGSARLLDWSPPPIQQQPSSCSSSPFPADGHTNRRFLFFLSNQLAICLNIQHSTAPVNRFFPLFYGLFIRSYYLMERPAGCCAIEAARLYGNGREQIREVALQTRSTSSWRIAIPPASGVISLMYQRDNLPNTSKLFNTSSLEAP